MLKMKHKHHLDFPHFTFPLTHNLAFEKVSVDQQMEENIRIHDDDWQLDERPDTAQLEQFWQRVEDDVSRDPEWVHFSDN